MLLRLGLCAVAFAVACGRQDFSAPALATEGAELNAAAAHDSTMDNSTAEVPLAFSSRTVDLAMGFGESASQEVRLVGKLASLAKLRIESVIPPGPEVAILSAESGRPPGVRITKVGTQVGQQSGQAMFTTGLENPRELTLLYSWTVSGNLTVAPTNPFIDLRAPTPAIIVRVKSSRQDFLLRGADVVDGPFAAIVEHGAAAGEYSVRVTPAKRDSADASQRGFRGTLRLVSNDPAEPEKDLPLFALGPLRPTPQ